MSAYENAVGGKLKLKGKALDVKDGGIKKKKKRNKHSHEKENVTRKHELPAGAIYFYAIIILLISFIFLTMGWYNQSSFTGLLFKDLIILYLFLFVQVKLMACQQIILKTWPKLISLPMRDIHHQLTIG